MKFVFIAKHRATWWHGYAMRWGCRGRASMPG